MKVAIGFGVALPFAWLFFRYIVLIVIGDYDDFWHLWAGRMIAETGTVPRVDPVCFTTAGYDWINLNWLAQLVFYKTYLLWGLGGTSGVAALLALITVLGVVGSMRERNCHEVTVVLGLPLLLYAIVFCYGTRPQMFSFALLALLCLLLDRGVNRIRIFTITALLVLWNNLHGGAIFGYIVLLMNSAGMVIDRLLPGRRSNDLRHEKAIKEEGTGVAPSLWLAGAAALGFLSFAIHPHGYAALVHLLTYGNSMKPEFYQRIIELKPLSLSSSQGQLVLAYTVFGVAGLVLARKRAAAGALLTAGVFLGLTFSMQRMLTPFFIVSIPLVAQSWSVVLKRLRGAQRHLDRVQVHMRYVSAMVAITLSGLLGLWLVEFMPIRTGRGAPGQIESFLAPPTFFPVAAAQVIRSQRLPGRIFNEYGSGGYLGWTLYPERRLFIDGRGDLHSQGDAFAKYLAIIDLTPGWYEKLLGEDVRLVLMPTSSSLAAALKTQHAWRPISERDGFSLLGSPASLPAEAPRKLASFCPKTLLSLAFVGSTGQKQFRLRRGQT